MRAVCVDDEELVLNLTVSLCKEIPEITEAKGFTVPQEALSYLEEHPADIALLDIDMPEMSGIELAAKIKDMHPRTAILFLTGYAEYAVDAFSLHASGYLLKPIGRDRLLDEINYALSLPRKEEASHIKVRTFGNFDVMVDGEAVFFSRAKAKELFAFLVDQQGSSVTRAVIFATLWEEGEYDRKMQKQLDVIIRSLRATLEEYSISDVLEMQSGTLRICPEKLDCDLYHFLRGEPDAINAYRGEYMNSYTWASLTEAYIDQHL